MAKGRDHLFSRRQFWGLVWAILVTVAIMPFWILNFEEWLKKYGYDKVLADGEGQIMSALLSALNFLNSEFVKGGAFFVICYALTPVLWRAARKPDQVDDAVAEPLPAAAAIPRNVSDPLVTFGAYRISNSFRDAGENHGGQRKFLEIAIPVRFNRMVREPIISVTAMMAYRRSNGYGQRFKWDWRVREGETFTAGQQISIPLAYASDSLNHPSYLGDFRPGSGGSFGTMSDVVLRLDIVDGTGQVETKKLLIHVPGRDITSGAPRGIDQGGLFFIQEAGREIFPSEIVERITEIV